jgi:sulfur-carrier protein
MHVVTLASALARWLPEGSARSVMVNATTVRDALTEVFAVYPTLRGYVLDETGSVRHHVVVYVGGDAVRDKDDLSQPLPAAAEVHIFQALSGG